MSRKSHVSPIASLLAAVNGWRNALGWSRETSADEIVKAHLAIDGPERTGVVFEPRTKDVFKRGHTDAARIFRWLDDDCKDTNLLSVNMLPSVLAALPEDIRLHWLNEYLRPLGHCVGNIEQTAGAAPDVSRLLVDVLKEAGEATQALAESVADPSTASFTRAAKELGDAERAIHHALVELQPVIRAPASLKAVRAA